MAVDRILKAVLTQPGPGNKLSVLLLPRQNPLNFSPMYLEIRKLGFIAKYGSKVNPRFHTQKLLTSRFFKILSPDVGDPITDST